jgi:hypothetical protein
VKGVNDKKAASLFPVGRCRHDQWVHAQTLQAMLLLGGGVTDKQAVLPVLDRAVEGLTASLFTDTLV